MLQAQRVTGDRALLPEATAQGSTRKCSALQVEAGAQIGPHRGWPGAKKNTIAQPQTHQSGSQGGPEEGDVQHL